MEPNKISLLIELLGQMKNPTPEEFNLITAEFNKYKKDNNTNIPASNLTSAKRFYVMNEFYKDFANLVELQDKTKEGKFRSTQTMIMHGLFYELVTTIKQYDIDGYNEAGFNLTDAEFTMINQIRNLVFHVPANKETYETRLKWVILLPKNRILENSRALGRYINSAKMKYPEDSEEITGWTVHLDNAEIEELKNNCEFTTPKNI